jgi:hypothetical protein
MSIIAKNDRERHRKDIFLCGPISQPDATGFSVGEPDAIEPKPSAFFADFCLEHSIHGKSKSPITKSVASISKSTES